MKTESKDHTLKLTESITKLTKDWYTLIGPEHHKDRDCHWKIEATWSYGQPPEYKVIHNGYIQATIEKTYKSYDEALGGLKTLVQESIVNLKQDFEDIENTDYY